MTQSHIREKAGLDARIHRARVVTLIAAAIFCIIRGLAYIGPMSPETLITPVALISGDGRFMWVWTTAWILAAVLCIVDLVRGSTRIGLSLTVGLSFTWGAAYLAAWGLFDPGSRQWLTGATMATVAVIIFGLLAKVSALWDLVHRLSERDSR